uniref:DUF148 domain-containing protein n=1 Tax=Parastrongyloides trichosuri TaxID=131310 RepID=A0A0N4ZR22_PARTI
MRHLAIIIVLSIFLLQSIKCGHPGNENAIAEMNYIAYKSMKDLFFSYLPKNHEFLLGMDQNSSLIDYLDYEITNIKKSLEKVKSTQPRRGFNDILKISTDDLNKKDADIFDLFVAAVIKNSKYCEV